MSENNNPQKKPPSEQELEEIIKKVREELNSNVKIHVINVNQIHHMYKRMGKVSNFHYIGAVLCLAVGIYYAQAGSQAVPMALGVVMLVNMILALLAYRATTRIEKLMEMLQHTKKKIKK